MHHVSTRTTGELVAIPGHRVAILSAAPWVKLHQAVAKKREVHCLKTSTHCSRLIWTDCD